MNTLNASKNEMTAYQKLQTEIQAKPKTWLVTGAAGFIGSHLVETLLRLGQKVVGLDNLSTGHSENLTAIRGGVTRENWSRFRLLEGDITDLKLCRKACGGIDYVLHQAALGSVPRSIEDPLSSHASNVTGFLNMLLAGRDAQVSRFVYASSSSVYGDEKTLPKIEKRIGAPLSPYAATKYMDEVYAGTFARCYGIEAIGLRYFNVFGPRQDPLGPYAAVIPRWLKAMREGEDVTINGDGETSRDFCYVANVVQANLLAATTRNRLAAHEIFNVACHNRTTLNELYGTMREMLLPEYPALHRMKPQYRPFRPGDVRHSHATISKARRLLGYRPTHNFSEGLAETLQGELNGRRA